MPLIVRGRLRLSRRALPLVVVSGVLEAVGAPSVIGAHVSPATAVVLSSQFAAIALCRPSSCSRATRPDQVVGVSVIAVRVTALAIIRGDTARQVRALDTLPALGPRSAVAEGDVEPGAAEVELACIRA